MSVKSSWNPVKWDCLFLLLFVGMMSISACGFQSGNDGSDGPPDPSDDVSPTVSSTNPANGAVGTAINTSVSATFSEPMKESTLTTATFTLSGGDGPVSGTVSYSGTTAIFTPSSNLTGNTLYTATITTGAKSESGDALAADYVWSFTTGATPDTTAPTVSSTIPASGAVGTAINAAVSAVFSEPMDASTLTGSTFTLSGGGGPVAGTVAYNGTTAVFTPSSDLTGNTGYTATITTGAKDAAGNALAADYVWSFTTGATPDVTPPTVSSTNPAPGAKGVATNKTISATFSEAMNGATLTTATFTLSGGGGPVAGTVTYSGMTAIFTPFSDLTGNTGYTATITTGAKDAAGNALAANYAWTFTTGATPDVTAPTVSTTDPLDGVVGVPTNTAISATFSEAMNGATLTTATFTLSGGGGPVAGTVTYSGMTAIFTPTSDLTGSTAYTATITTGAEDAAGNGLAADYVWTFTTGATPDTTAPTFSGLVSAGLIDSDSAELGWTAGSDDTTDSPSLLYRIFMATTAGAQNFAVPSFVTAPGAVSYTVNGLTADSEYFFVVRAVDLAGNEDSNTVELAVATVEWEDPTGTPTPVNLDPSVMADEPSLAFDGDDVYVAWVESAPDGNNQTYVKRWTGGAMFEPVGSSLNVNVTSSSKEATVAFLGTTLYAAWSENKIGSGVLTAGDVYVKRYVSGAWESVGGSLTIASAGLSPIGTIGHSPAIIPETPHIAFKQEDESGINQLFVKRWNEGAGTWDLLPGPNANGSLNADPAKAAGLPVLAYLGTVPYVVWVEGTDTGDEANEGNAYVYRWDGAEWDAVGGKLNTGVSNHHPWITSDGTTVYVSWIEKNEENIDQIHVSKWTGTEWSALGGSLNFDPSEHANNARVAVAVSGDSVTPYALWVEKNASDIYVLYARRWDGAHWLLLGSSLNEDTDHEVSEPHLAVNGDVPYATWVEVDEGTGEHSVYVKRLP